MGVAGSTLTGTRWLGELHGPGGVFFVLYIQLKVGSVCTSTCRYTKHPSLPDVRAATGSASSRAPPEMARVAAAGEWFRCDVVSPATPPDRSAG
jgi:hypothetical protein